MVSVAVRKYKKQRDKSTKLGLGLCSCQKITRHEHELVGHIPIHNTQLSKQFE
jgi:hypothetical protein